MTNRLDHQPRAATATGEDHRHVIAIDGPAAAGKTTVARALAARLGATYLDTGLLYRAVTLAALRAGLLPTDGKAVAALTRGLDLRVLPAVGDSGAERVLIDGVDVTSSLRTPEIDRAVSAYSALPLVRAELLPIQRRISAEGRVVIVGRDITTVVVPDAGIKVFLDASPLERARRRVAEIRANGGNADLAQLLSEIEARDEADSNRAVAPLMAGNGATIVDTDGRTIAEVVDEIANLALQSWQNDSRGARSEVAW